MPRIHRIMAALLVAAFAAPIALAPFANLERPKGRGAAGVRIAAAGLLTRRITRGWSAASATPIPVCVGWRSQPDLSAGDPPCSTSSDRPDTSIRLGASVEGELLHGGSRVGAMIETLVAPLNRFFENAG